MEASALCRAPAGQSFGQDIDFGSRSCLFDKFLGLGSRGSEWRKSSRHLPPSQRIWSSCNQQCWRGIGQARWAKRMKTFPVSCWSADHKWILWLSSKIQLPWGINLPLCLILNAILFFYWLTCTLCRRKGKPGGRGLASSACRSQPSSPPSIWPLLSSPLLTVWKKV